MDLKVFSLNAGYSPLAINLSPEARSFDEVSRLLSQGVYTTFRTFGAGRRVLGLHAHLSRIYNSSHQKGVLPSISTDELRMELQKLLVMYQQTEARVRISLSIDDEPGRMYVMLEPLHLLSANIYEHGVNVVTSDVKRNTPRLKSTTFIQSSSDERSFLRKSGIFEALIVKNKHIMEGITSNFYAIKENCIITARYGILLGVTRQAVLRVMRNNGMIIDYRSLRIDEIPGIDGAFITSSSRGIVPVVNIDGIAIGQGAPGEIVKLLIKAYDAYAMVNAENI